MEDGTIHPEMQRKDVARINRRLLLRRTRSVLRT